VRSAAPQQVLGLERPGPRRRESHGGSFVRHTATPHAAHHRIGDAGYRHRGRAKIVYRSLAPRHISCRSPGLSTRSRSAVPCIVAHGLIPLVREYSTAAVPRDPQPRNAGSISASARSAVSAIVVAVPIVVIGTAHRLASTIRRLALRLVGGWSIDVFFLPRGSGAFALERESVWVVTGFGCQRHHRRVVCPRRRCAYRGGHRDRVRARSFVSVWRAPGYGEHPLLVFQPDNDIRPARVDQHAIIAAGVGLSAAISAEEHASARKEGSTFSSWDPNEICLDASGSGGLRPNAFSSPEPPFQNWVHETNLIDVRTRCCGHSSRTASTPASRIPNVEIISSRRSTIPEMRPVLAALEGVSTGARRRLRAHGGQTRQRPCGTSYRARNGPRSLTLAAGRVPPSSTMRRRPRDVHQSARQRRSHRHRLRRNQRLAFGAGV